MGNFFEDCLATFHGYSNSYPIFPEVYAGAGFTWAGVVDLVECKDCNFRCQFTRQTGPGLPERVDSTYLKRVHRELAGPARCRWARLDAELPMTLREARLAEGLHPEYEYKEVPEDFGVLVRHKDLMALKRAYQMLVAVMGPLGDKVGWMLADQPCPRGMREDMRNLWKVAEELRRIGRDLEGC